MTVVTADSSLQKLLTGLKDRAEVRDAKGTVLGYLTPRDVEEELLYQHADQVFDPEQIERLLAEQKGGKTIDQVITELHSRESS